MTPETLWFARRRDARLAQQTEDAFRTWLATQPENGVRYEQCALVWERAAELAPDPQVRHWLHELDARLESGSARTASIPRRAGWRWAAAAALLLCIGAGVFFGLQGPIYNTSTGEQRHVRLPDGSLATLNTATRIAVRYGKDGRRIELITGEALFDVRPEPGRPFEVLAAGAVARALGTKFAVQRQGPEVTVSVLEGMVELRKESRRLLPPLAGGEAATIDGPGAVATARPANIRRIQAWRDRKLDFEATPLADAITEVNRYAMHPLVLGRPELSDLKISGVFHIDTLDGFTFALQRTMGLHVEDRGEEVLILPP